MEYGGEGAEGYPPDSCHGTRFDLESDEIILRGWPMGTTAAPEAAAGLHGRGGEEVAASFPRHEEYSVRVMEMLALSHGLAQSVKLVVFEREMDKLVRVAPTRAPTLPLVTQPCPN
jgi:hypothetical protein